MFVLLRRHLPGVAEDLAVESAPADRFRVEGCLRLLNEQQKVERADVFLGQRGGRYSRSARDRDAPECHSSEQQRAPAEDGA